METMEQTGCDLILFGQKTPQSLIQQGMEGSTTLGKDEVGSSNLPSSSKKASKTSVFDAFCCKNAEKCVGQNVGQLPDPHRDPHNEINCTQENGHEILTHGPVRRTRI